MPIKLKMTLLVILLLEIIEQVYALPLEEINGDVDAAREKVRTQFTEKCIATPHDKMPDYKPF